MSVSGHWPGLVHGVQRSGELEALECAILLWGTGGARVFSLPEEALEQFRGRNYFLLTVHFVTPLASLPWPRRASRVVARGSRVLGGVVGPSRLARRAFSIESGRSPNQPATA